MISLLIVEATIRRCSWWFCVVRICF